jgi:hypothetical protein
MGNNMKNLVKGNLVWKDGIVDTYVEFVKCADGKYTMGSDELTDKNE